MNKAQSKETILKAILGPTNTGKTFYAMDRMLSHKTGMIGFPLRLLARENYDKAVGKVGKNNVALVTGEEKIIPSNAKFYCCTVEAMPIEKKVSFLCVDEIQLASDPERGYVFTDRLLHARGTEETIFLGSEVIKNIIRMMLPFCKIETRPRLSALSYSSVKKITRLKERSAIVTFSIPEIYQIAELVRSQKGGAAVVMGALSPRTRNHQVEMYQNGEVDFLVATDAIGMGLNLDIEHVAFASDTKFDGNNLRKLFPTEISQIAGRAGRSTKNGTFGVIDEDLKFNKEIVDMVENHQFQPLSNIWWRNSILDFSSIKSLINSLEKMPQKSYLRKKGNALDFLCLTKLSKLPNIIKEDKNQFLNELLWDICQIPDFGNSFSDRHIKLIEQLYSILMYRKIDDEWIKDQVFSLKNFDGDIDTLLNRISNIRTWTYITNKSSWIINPELWQYETKNIENRLSDELHERLTKRFVDKKIAILSKKMSKKLDLEAIVKFDGKVIVEGQEVGILNNFDFIPDNLHNNHSSRILTAARKALPKEIEKRVKDFENSSEDALKIDNLGNILWMESSIAKLIKGSDIYNPKIVLNNLEFLSIDQKRKIQNKCQKSINKKIEKLLSSCIKLKNIKSVNDPKTNSQLEISPKIKALAFHIYEGVGLSSTKALPFQAKNLDEKDKYSLAKLGMRLGVSTIYLPILLKPKVINLKSVLWSVFNNKFFPNCLPNDGRVNFQVKDNIDKDFIMFIGYLPLINIVLRVDIYERLLALIRIEAKNEQFKITDTMLSIAGTTKDEIKNFILSMNYKLIDDIKIGSYENKDFQDYIFEKIPRIKNKYTLNKNHPKKIKMNKKSNENKNSPFYVLKSLKK